MNPLSHGDPISANTDAMIISNELNDSHEERNQKISQILREERPSNKGPDVHAVLNDPPSKKTQSSDGPPATEVTPLARGSGPPSEPPILSRQRGSGGNSWMCTYTRYGMRAYTPRRLAREARSRPPLRVGGGDGPEDRRRRSSQGGGAGDAVRAVKRICE
mmetsp:Transcript_29065/g.61681  ORF Transcript_29065/g.61681 Transcript_29065/m.61681 type:complete len:161 (+) Transcript_29065:437-919(+)